MTDPYTPTTEEVRTNYAMDYIHAVKGATPEDYIPKVREFDRWLAQHDAELRRQVAREIRAHAEHVDGPRGANALERAARIAEAPDA